MCLLNWSKTGPEDGQGASNSLTVNVRSWQNKILSAKYLATSSPSISNSLPVCSEAGMLVIQWFWAGHAVEATQNPLGRLHCHFIPCSCSSVSSARPHLFWPSQVSFQLPWFQIIPHSSFAQGQREHLGAISNFCFKTSKGDPTPSLTARKCYLVLNQKLF